MTFEQVVLVLMLVDIALNVFLLMKLKRAGL